MRALMSTEPGGPERLRLMDVPSRPPGPDEIVIAVKRAALNYPDWLIIQDRYQMRPPRPFAPGSEAAGVVEAVGADIRDIAIGQRVVGLAGWGALAEKMVVSRDNCVPIGADVPFDEAAALMVTYSTSHYALRDAGIAAGDTLLVLGAAGGVGIAAVQLGKAFGAHVIAAVSSTAKAERVLTEGADAAIVYPADIAARADARSFTDAVRAACPAGAADLVFDPIGGGYSEPAFRTLGWRGRHLVVGFTAGIPALPLNLTLLKGASVRGVFYGDFARREPARRDAYRAEIVDLHAAGRIKPHISVRMKLDDAAAGLARLGDRAATGKIVIDME